MAMTAPRVPIRLECPTLLLHRLYTSLTRTLLCIGLIVTLLLYLNVTPCYALSHMLCYTDLTTRYNFDLHQLKRLAFTADRDLRVRVTSHEFQNISSSLLCCRPESLIRRSPFFFSSANSFSRCNLSFGTVWYGSSHLKQVSGEARRECVPGSPWTSQRSKQMVHVE
jgi:hypothetical protein